MLQVGAADGGGAFGPQRQAVAAAVVEDVHLLLDDVGAFADAAGEELGMLEGGRLDESESGEPSLFAGMAEDVRVHVVVLGQQIARAARGLKLSNVTVGHGQSSPIIVQTPSG